MPNIIDKLFSSQISKSVASYCSSTFSFNRLGSLKGTDNKYVKGGKKAHLESYEEELYVYGCVYLISNTIASIPLQIYTDDTKKNKVESHPFYDLMSKPNYKDSQFDIKESISANLELNGNGYLLKDGLIKNDTIPTEIYSLISSLVEIEYEENKDKTLTGYISKYKYNSKPINANQIIHERKFNPTNDMYGMSPIQPGALTIGSAQEAKRRNYNIFNNGASSDVVLETDQPLDDVKIKRLRAEYTEKHSGTENAHIPIVLFNGLKYRNAGIALKDLEYITGLKLSREEICGFMYQIPPILLGILDNASYNNISEATKIFYNMSIIPRLVKNRELFQKLLDCWGGNEYVDFDLSGIDALQESYTNKISDLQKLWQIGVPVTVGAKLLNIPLDKFKGNDVSYLPFSVSPVGSEPAQPVTPPAEPKTLKNKIVWTEEKKEAKWKAFVNITDKIETKYKPDLKQFFIEQEKIVLSELNKYKSFNFKEVEVNKFLLLAETETETKAINPDKIIFDVDDETKRLVKVSNPIHAEALLSNAEYELSLLDLGISFNMSNPRVASFLAKYGLDKAKEVNQTVKDKIKEQLILGINEGESIPKLSARINEVYAGYKDLKSYELERIARTEVIGSANKGSLEAYKQAGIKTKVWLPAYERTRDTHIAAGRDYAKGIPIDENFEVGADSMQSPGSGSLAEENINCRCALISGE